jgi:hypothetical protein
MDPATYAQTVVAKVIQADPPEIIWAGQSSTLVWLIELVGMQWFYVFSLSRKYGLNKPITTRTKT